MKASHIVLLLSYVVVTWLQWDVISSSSISLFLFPLLAVRAVSFREFLRPELLEYWLAAAVWLGTGIWLLMRSAGYVQKRPRAPSPVVQMERKLAILRQRGGTVLVLAVYVSLTCPFLVRVGPNVQGNLVTSRLLPPLSSGYITESEEGKQNTSRDRLEEIFEESNYFILDRPMSVSGSATSPAPGGAKQSRMIFLFGTDDTGRDVFSRVVYGTRVSLVIGVIAALGAVLIGSFVGFVAGMSRGVFDSVLMRCTDLFLAIPGLFLVIGFMAFVGQTGGTVAVILALTGWMGIARMVRGEVRTLREREFILAAGLLGVPKGTIILRHLLPNVRPVMLTAAVLQFGNAVLAESALGFLGLGIQPPTASWGNMMGEATGYLGAAWWIGFFPGAVLALMLVSVHVFGERTLALSGPVSDQK